MPGTQIDTALARRLHDEQVLDVATLQECLEEVREQRGVDPDVSLALLLIERRLVPGERLDPIVQALVAELGSGPHTPQPGEATIGSYRVIRPLASGGMGAVYEVEHTETGARYALKTLHAEWQGDPEVQERFRLEAELNARLDHPHVVRIHEAHLAGARPYLIQDLVTGGNLEERLAEGPLPLEEALSITLQLGQALAHAHAREVIHRDLKPLNVLLDEQGQPRLTDFGLARSLRATSLRLTVTGTLLGTPNYMPPEQALGKKEVGAASDVYGLGGILYACLTQKSPFPGSAMYEVLDRVLNQPHPSLRESRSDLEPGASEALDRLLSAMLAKAPEDRPSLEEALDTLTRLRHGEVGTARRRNRRIALAIGVLLTLALGLGLVVYRLHAQQRTQAARLALSAAHDVELDLFERWLLGLADGADPPDPEVVAGVARALQQRQGDLGDAPEAAAVLARLRALRRLLAPNPTVLADVSAGATDQLVDAVLLARAGRRSAARAPLERALSQLESFEQRAAWLLRVELCADVARLQVVAASLPARCQKARRRAAQRFETELRERAEALAVAPSGDRLRSVGRMLEALRSCGRTEAQVTRAKREAFEASAPTWGQRLKQASRRAWLRDSLNASPPCAIGPQLLAVVRAELKRQLGEYERGRSDRRRDVSAELETAVELDHLLSYAPDSTWKTSIQLATAVELPLLNKAGIKDPRIRTYAAGVALRGRDVTQPAFRALLQSGDPATIREILEARPGSQVFRVLAVGPSDRVVGLEDQVAWIRELERALTKPGQGELNPTWVVEIHYQLALAMRRTKGFTAAEAHTHARRAYDAKRLLDTLRIQSTSSILAGTLAELNKLPEANAVMRGGITWLRDRLRKRRRAGKPKVARFQRSLLTLIRGFSHQLVGQGRPDQALKVLTECDPILKTLRAYRQEERLQTNAYRAHALLAQGKHALAWKTLDFDRAPEDLRKRALQGDNVVAEVTVLLTRELKGDAAARALLQRCGERRLRESPVLQELAAELTPR